jgi:hypothetical protein
MKIQQVSVEADLEQKALSLPQSALSEHEKLHGRN